MPEDIRILQEIEHLARKQRIKTDEEWSEFTQRLVDAAMQHFGVDENDNEIIRLNISLNQLKDASMNSEPTQKSKTPMLLAAGVAIVLVGGGYLFYQQNQTSSTAPETSSEAVAMKAPTPVEAAGKPRASKPASAAAGSFAIEFKKADQLKAVEGHSVSVTDDGVLLRSTATEATSGGRTGAPHFALSKSFAKSVIGKTVRVKIVARAAETEGSNEFLAAYSTAGSGNSKWRKFALKGSDAFAEYSFDFPISKDRKRESADFIGIWPDQSGKNLGVVLKSITVEIVG